MPALLLVLLIVASFVLVVEFLLTAVARLIAYQPGIDRFAQLTGLTPSPVAYRAMGVLAVAGVAGIIGGGWRPALAVVAAAYFALVAAFILTRQFQRGQRGSALLPYSLFLLLRRNRGRHSRLIPARSLGGLTLVEPRPAVPEWAGQHEPPRSSFDSARNDLIVSSSADTSA